MKQFKTIIAIILASALTSGCVGTGSNYRPIVDNKNVDLNRYEADLQECQAYARQTASAGKSAAGGAIIGAALGLGLALIGGSGYDKGVAAGVGAAVGGAGGADAGETNQRNIIRNCLGGRGYRVLQ